MGKADYQKIAENPVLGYQSLRQKRLAGKAAEKPKPEPEEYKKEYRKAA